VSFSPEDRLIARASPVGFAHVLSRGAYVPFAHLLLLDEQLSALCHGELRRLIVSMPPRHGKSETISKYLPAWYLGRFPDRRVMLASYEASFAQSWGRKARELVAEFGPQLFDVEVCARSAASGAWELAGRAGGMVAAGVGGPLTGRGAHLLVIDDPVKNHEQAQSELPRDKTWDWWRSTARSRLQRDAAVVLVMTRWHEDDLAGRLLAHDQELDEADREGWSVLELPAVAEPGDERADGEDPLGRAAGEALCPELGFDEAWARRTKASVGSYWWAALYQQHPRPADGLLFKRQSFRYFRSVPPGPEAEHGLYVLEKDDGLRPIGRERCSHFQTADTAASESEQADYTVVATWAVTPERELLLIDLQRQRFEALDVGGFLERAYHAAEPRPAFLGVEDFGASGLGVVHELSSKGLSIRRLRPDHDKVTRALLAVARYDEQRVYHARGAPWLRELEDELLAFPNAAHDDQVDVVAYAARELPRIASVRPRRKYHRHRTVMEGIRTSASRRGRRALAG
jgi:predicted phage terminase large subunit-like protein